MLKSSKILLVCLLLFTSCWQAMGYAVQFTDETQTVRLRWKTNLIPIALSTSLTKPNPYIKPDTDVKGAIERSLATWEKSANIKFQTSWIEKQTASPAGKAGDGLSLITIAPTPENLLMFSDSQEVSARTRIFFNRRGNITEADVVLNPYEQFTTDGSIGTFDLEATLTHEIGHLLGLDHASIIGATMNAHIGKNGVYNLSGFSARTLAEDDIAGIRALYGAKNDDNSCCGAIGGKLTNVSGKPIKDSQVWVEDAETGRVAAGILSNADGSFQIEGLSNGRYNVYVQSATKASMVEKLGEIETIQGKTQLINKKLSVGKRDFDLQYVGFNGQLSDLAIPVNGGKSYMIYIGGTNLNTENLTIGFNSPFLKLTPKSLVSHNYDDGIKVISFEVKVAAEIPLGEYSFFLKSNKDEMQFAVGSLTVEQFSNPWNSYFLTNSDR